MGKDRKLDFGTYEEAAEWFDTHDMADYENLMQPVDFSFDLRKNRDWVELENDIARNVRELAKRQKIPTRRLVNELLRERLTSLQQSSPSALTGGLSRSDLVFKLSSGKVERQNKNPEDPVNPV